MNPVAFYEKVSGDYDLPLNEYFYKSIGASLISQIQDDSQFDSILEVGAGTGFSTLKLRDRYPNAEITAIEPSMSMRIKAQDRLPDVKWSSQDLDGFLPSQHFDLIVCSMAGHWLDSGELNKLFGIAKGSTLAISLPVNPGNNQVLVEGNKEIKKLICKLKPKPSWPKENRSFPIFYKKLEHNFKDLKVTDLKLCENYDSYKDLANNLYVRGVLLALFGDQAQKAKEILCHKEQDQVHSKIQFEWFFKLIVAR